MTDYLANYEKDLDAHMTDYKLAHAQALQVISDQRAVINQLVGALQAADDELCAATFLVGRVVDRQSLHNASNKLRAALSLARPTEPTRKEPPKC